MKRRLFNLLAAVSLVLCVGGIALWIAAQFACYRVVALGDRHSFYCIGAARDSIFLLHDIVSPSDDPPSRWWSKPPITVGKWTVPPEGWSHAGFAFGRHGPFYWMIGMPHWLLPTCSLITLVSLVRLSRDPSKTGCCKRCGYDLRASKERCPECGTAIPAGGPAAAAEAK